MGEDEGKDTGRKKVETGTGWERLEVVTPFQPYSLVNRSALYCNTMLLLLHSSVVQFEVRDGDTSSSYFIIQD